MKNALAKLIGIANDRADMLQLLIGIIPSDVSLEDEREKRLSEI